MTPRALMGIAVGLLLVADAPTQDATKQDKEKLQGTWTVVSFERDGKQFTAKDIKNLKWTFAADKITWSDGDDFLYKLDPTKKPKAIDLQFPENKNEITEGIYALEGDDLKVCIGKTGRPTDFTAQAGSKRYLYVLKKQKS
jgi:uncharacterized protein (TIGR03067 family)